MGRTNWKLPSHLEPYRKYVSIFEWYGSIEEALNGTTTSWAQTEQQVDLLQRLFDAGKLK